MTKHVVALLRHNFESPMPQKCFNARRCHLFLFLCFIQLNTIWEPDRHFLNGFRSPLFTSVWEISWNTLERIKNHGKKFLRLMFVLILRWWKRRRDCLAEFVEFWINTLYFVASIMTSPCELWSVAENSLRTLFIVEGTALVIAQCGGGNLRSVYSIKNYFHQWLPRRFVRSSDHSKIDRRYTWMAPYCRLFH